MSVLSFAMIGKNRQPIYIQEFVNHNDVTTDTADLIMMQDVVSDMDIFGIKSSSSLTASKTSLSSSYSTIRQQFILHDALDIMEQWIESNNYYSNNNQQQQQQILNPLISASVAAHDAMFAGLLYPIEDMRIYVVQDTATFNITPTVEPHTNNNSNNNTTKNVLDHTIKQLFIKLHRIYVEYILNPFTPISFNNHSTMIESKQFHEKINHCIESYNNNINHTN